MMAGPTRHVVLAAAVATLATGRFHLELEAPGYSRRTSPFTTSPRRNTAVELLSR